MINDFINVIRENLGAAPSADKVIPNQWIYFSLNGKPSDTAGRCLLFSDGEGGVYWDWRSGDYGVWQAREHRTPEERATFDKKIQEARAEAAKEEEKRRSACRERSVAILSVSFDAGQHPYLAKKGVKAHGIKQHDGILVISAMDLEGKVHGLQKIGSDGEKSFEPGTAVKSHFFPIGNLLNSGKILIAEGFATSATAHEATGFPTVCAFNASNLLPVALGIQEKYPHAEIIICSDDDWQTPNNPGLAAATAAAKAVDGLLAVPVFPDNRGPKDSDFNDLARLDGLEAVKACINAATMSTPSEVHIEEIPKESEAEYTDPLQDYAASIFPYQLAFPWQIFPGIIAESLLACAESCATSPTALAGVAFAILSSAIGRTILISPKTSWNEPLHCWFADIRPSGEGKTPAMQLLARVLHEAQSKSDADFENEKDTWEQTPKKERGPEPRWNRSYFVSGLTLEGVRAALWQGHGGLVCLLSELSSFITGQGQYKSGKGDDREAWLSLHDGSPARIVRAGSSVTIQGARVSICGGIQPEVFKTVFGDKGGLFLTDGTIFRFLLTYEPAGHFELTRATWNEQHRFTWENLVNKALWWADDKFKSSDNFLILKLSDDAWSCFSAFRNNLYSLRNQFPPAFRGFIPKATSYILRIAGLLHVMEQLFTGDDISPVITAETIQKAILAVNFYTGHALEALKLLHGKETAIQQDNAQKHIMAAIESLIAKTEEQSFVSVKDIADAYNSISGKAESAKYIGGLLREIGLEPKQVFHGRYGIRNDDLQKILKTKSPKSPSHPSQQHQGFAEGDFKNHCHPSHPGDYMVRDNQVTLVTSEKQSHPPQMPVNIERGDLGDIGDFVSKESEFYKVDCSLEVLR